MWPLFSLIQVYVKWIFSAVKDGGNRWGRTSQTKQAGIVVIFTGTSWPMLKVNEINQLVASYIMCLIIRIIDVLHRKNQELSCTLSIFQLQALISRYITGIKVIKNKNFVFRDNHVTISYTYVRSPNDECTVICIQSRCSLLFFFVWDFSNNRGRGKKDFLSETTCKKYATR